MNGTGANRPLNSTSISRLHPPASVSSSSCLLLFAGQGSEDQKCKNLTFRPTRCFAVSQRRNTSLGTISQSLIAHCQRSLVRAAMARPIDWQAGFRSTQRAILMRGQKPGLLLLGPRPRHTQNPATLHIGRAPLWIAAAPQHSTAPHREAGGTERGAAPG